MPRTSTKNRPILRIAPFSQLFTLFALLTLVAAACAPSRDLSGDAPPSEGGERKAMERRLTLLFFADLHAQVEEHPELFWDESGDRIAMAGGFARVAQAIRDERAQAPKGSVFVIDGGDTFQGSKLAALTEGEALVPLLSNMGFDLAIPGNWEVAYGAARMRSLLAKLPYPTIAENVFVEASGERILPPSILREIGGVKVGFIGYTDPDVPRRQPPSFSEGLRYGGPDSLNELAASLREDGAELVVLVSHIGLARAAKLTERLKGIDLHLSSDTHERSFEPIDVNGVWVVEPGAFGSFMGKIELTLKGDVITERRWSLIPLEASRFPEAADIAARVEEVMRPHRESLERELGEVAETMARYDVVETTIDNLLADALRAETGTEIALSNGFRFGTPLLPGPFTEADLYNLYPITMPVKTGEVSGQQLLDFFEQELENVFSADPERRFGGWVTRLSGVELTFRAFAPKGERIERIEINGEPLDPHRIYTVTACEREGDAFDTLCRIPHVQNPKVLDFDAHEAVRRYLRKERVLRAPDRDRVIALDLPRHTRSQLLQPEPRDSTSKKEPPVVGGEED
ncbi:MAG: bifunctional metallophosphatase/5'-nucleotidase [Sandaracinaceae bacterium]|nr:bifunctional metallophosphatase/5'-nucleotidase [Sandaracinaceae bacterium]